MLAAGKFSGAECWSPFSKLVGFMLVSFIIPQYTVFSNIKYINLFGSDFCYLFVILPKYEASIFVMTTDWISFVRSRESKQGWGIRVWKDGFPYAFCFTCEYRFSCVLNKLRDQCESFQKLLILEYENLRRQAHATQPLETGHCYEMTSESCKQ